MPDTRFVLESDGAVYRESVERRRVAADVARVFADAALSGMQVVTPSLGKGPSFSQLRLAFPLVRRSGPLAAAVQLSGLNFRTSWVETEDGFMIPSFSPDGTQIDPATLPGEAFKCALPADCAEAWLVFLLPGNGQAFSGIKAWLPTLVRVRESGASKWRWSMLPVPNQHGNGQLCFGGLPGGLEWTSVLRLAAQIAEMGAAAGLGPRCISLYL